MVAEEGVAEVNRLMPRFTEGVEMSQLRPSWSHTILDLSLTVRCNGLEQVVVVLVSQVMEVTLGVSAGGCRSVIWSAECQIIDVQTIGVPAPHAMGKNVVAAGANQRLMTSTSSVCHAGASHCVEHARPGS